MSKIAREAYKARATAYYPDDSPLEGGHKDRRGKPLRTLQDFLEGKAPFVSVAMDLPAGSSSKYPQARGLWQYGQRLCIPDLNEKYGRVIDFRVVDTGGAFIGKGTTRIDICVRNRRASLDSAVNATVTLIPC